MQQYKTQYWSVNLPTLWGAEHTEECDILYDKAGVGELVFSTLYEADGIPDDQLEEIASEHIDADAVIEDININSFDGFTLRYVSEGEFWIEWYLRSETLLLFISYNCAEEDEEIDEDVVESIMESLKELN